MGFVDRLTGKTAGQAAIKAGETQAGFAQEAGALLDPFAALGQQGISQAGFLTDPQAQFDFLQQNPLFQLGLDNANTSTLQSAASRGRLSSGDTLQQLTNNALLTASPLIQQQKQSIGDLLNLGFGAAGSQGNLLTGQGAALAGGIVGKENARSAGLQNIIDIGGQAAAAAGFSDPALKDDVKLTGTKNGFNIYTWKWNEMANSLNLFGRSKGVMADEVKKIKPEAITIDRGFMKVNYAMIGV